MKMPDAKRTALLSVFAVGACCIVPLVLVVFGIGSAALGTKFIQFHLWFLGVGVVMLGASYALYFHKGKGAVLVNDNNLGWTDEKKQTESSQARATD